MVYTTMNGSARRGRRVCLVFVDLDAVREGLVRQAFPVHGNALVELLAAHEEP